MVVPLTILALPIGLGLGALHALEPGHSKTMVAAFLIGIKGTKRDALWLGISAAATHSIVVISLAIAAVWLGREIVTDSVVRWLQVGSGTIVIAVGGYLLWRRWPRHRVNNPHHHAPVAALVHTKGFSGTIEIIETAGGERMRLRVDESLLAITSAEVLIQRDGDQVERLALIADPSQPAFFTSQAAPEEPHEFLAELRVAFGEAFELMPFSVHEPAHEHGHHDLDEDAHARAHAAAMPTYSATGGRPSFGQILAFGAAGGMVPCPASITVMLLALSTFSPQQFVIAIAAVFCFSIGLACTLVGIGLVVVTGARRAQQGGRFAHAAHWAPLVSSAVIMLSGIAAVGMSFLPHHG